MASYYRTIKGKKYDRALLELAESLTSGRGDGRISLQDARAILKKVKDGGEYSDTEKRTMQYIRDNFKFTDSANKWFRDEIRKWAATKKKTVKKSPAKKTVKKAVKKAPAKKKASAKKKSAKKAPAKKKSAAQKAVKKKTAPKPAPVPAEPYISTVPEPSPILQQQEKKEKEGIPWIKLLIALIIIIAAIYFIRSLWNCSPAKDTDSSAVKIEKKAEIPAKDTTPPAAKKEGPVEKPVDISIERQAPVVDSIESLKVYFAKGSGWINHKQRKKLLKIAEYLKAHPDRKIFIIGHACSLGNAKLNNDLSLYRARNAKKYLKLKGVAEDQILLVGIGAKHPVKQGLSPENLWENRLIEFDVR